MQVCILRRPGPAAALAFVLALTAAPAAPVAPSSNDKKPIDSAADKVRKALDQNIAKLEIDNQQLGLAIDQLREETKINFVLDRATLAQFGIDADNAAPVKAKLENVKARAALRTILNPYGLAYAIIGDSVIVTTEDMAVYRQLKQRVSVDLDRVQMEKALKGLARETATNVLVDHRGQKEAQTPVTLQLDDVPLETAVRLIAEEGGLKAVRMGNVVLVTTKAHAAELRSEPELAPAPRFPGADGAMPPGIAVPAVPLAPPPAPGPAGGAAPTPPAVPRGAPTPSY